MSNLNIDDCEDVNTQTTGRCDVEKRRIIYLNNQYLLGYHSRGPVERDAQSMKREKIFFIICKYELVNYLGEKKL